MPFKPMLATAVSDVKALTFPVLASQKLDGVRATVQNGRLLSRSLKPIPNKNVQTLFAGLPEGLDGELIVGDPTASDAYRRTTSIVMSDDKPATGICFHVFDRFGEEGFASRLMDAHAAIYPWISRGCVQIVQHVKVSSAEELEQLEAAWLAEGHEGVMVRSLGGPYKQGRSSEREGYLLKLKRFLDAEALVIGTYEMHHNNNVATTNALGRTERSTEKAGMVPAGVLGGLSVRDTASGVEFEIGGGYTAAMRESMWKERDQLVGKIAKYKYFPTGSKERPRFPVFLGWRDARDMS